MYYVYVLCRPNGKPFYVGKGKNNRLYLHDTEARSGCKCHKCNVIRKIWRSGGRVVRYVVFTTQDEVEAFAYERETIALFGRETLCNHTDGGEGPSGRKHSKQEIQRRVSGIRRAMSDPSRKARWRAALAAYHQSEAAFERKSESMRRYYRSPEGRAAASERSLRTWANPEVRRRRLESLREAVTQLEYKAKKAEESRARWADPEYKARVSASIKAAQNQPEAKAYRRALMRERYANPEERRRQGERARASHSQPDVRARISQRTKEGMASPAIRARLSEQSTAHWQDSEYRAKTIESIRRANGTPEKRALYSEQQKAYRATEDGRAAAKRASRASAKKSAVLTRAQGVEIQTLWATGEHRQRDLANRFGVGQTTIWRLLNNPEMFNYKDES